MSDRDKQSSNAPTPQATGPAARSGHHPKPRRAGMTILRVASLGYVAILLGLVLMESRLVYPGAFRNVPEARLGQTHSNAQNSRDIIDVSYESADGVRLTGRLLNRHQAENTLLFFHGNASRAIWLDEIARQLADSFDATVLVAEYRGFDGSGVTPNEPGVINDCLAARDYLCSLKNITPCELILFGRSLGGGCAVAVAADKGAKALVLDRTFGRLVDVAAGRFPLIPIRLLMRNEYDSIERISRYDGPVVQLHGDVDEVIPIENAKLLYAAAKPPKRWIEVKGLGHIEQLSDKMMLQLAVQTELMTEPAAHTQP